MASKSFAVSPGSPPHDAMAKINKACAKTCSELVKSGTVTQLVADKVASDFEKHARAIGGAYMVVLALNRSADTVLVEKLIDKIVQILATCQADELEKLADSDKVREIMVTIDHTSDKLSGLFNGFVTSQEIATRISTAIDDVCTKLVAAKIFNGECVAEFSEPQEKTAFVVSGTQKMASDLGKEFEKQKVEACANTIVSHLQMLAAIKTRQEFMHKYAEHNRIIEKAKTTVAMINKRLRPEYSKLMAAKHS